MAEPKPDWWVDGQRGALLPPDDRGLLYGDGVFRTLLVWDGQADDLRGQLDHLQADCVEIGLDAADAGPLSDEIQSAANSMGRGCLRITLTRGSGGVAYDPRGAGPARRILQARGLPGCAGRPVTACLLDTTAGGLGGAKHLNRLHNVLAAARVPAAVDTAILRSADGQLLSGLQANLFLVDAAGQLLTPPAAAGVVAGVPAKNLLPLSVITHLQQLTVQDPEGGGGGGGLRRHRQQPLRQAAQRSCRRVAKRC